MPSFCIFLANLESDVHVPVPIVPFYHLLVLSHILGRYKMFLFYSNFCFKEELDKQRLYYGLISTSCNFKSVCPFVFGLHVWCEETIRS